MAERAGVQRLTVYRHFPSEREILGACTSKWRSLHPPPDVSSIDAGNPPERTRAVLLEFYRYYERTRRMWASAYRDPEKVPDLAEPMAEFEQYRASSIARPWMAGPRLRLGERLGALNGATRARRVSTAPRDTRTHRQAFFSDIPESRRRPC